MENPPKNIRINAADDYPLNVSLFQPTSSNSKTVLIAPATGVKKSLYHNYASFLSEKGFTVITWDWRGIGDNRPSSLRGFQVTMRDWGKYDLTGIINWALQNTSNEVTAVGHSYGGQCFGLAENAVQLKRIVTIAGQSGYWLLWPQPARYKYALLWYVMMPLLTHSLGYFPAKFLKLGEDLPKQVALEWSKWCRSENYMETYDGHQRIDSPLLALSFSDDNFAPLAAVNDLHQHYGSSIKKMRHISPQDMGVQRIGHFGFFRKDRVPALWEETSDWLNS